MSRTTTTVRVTPVVEAELQTLWSLAACGFAENFLYTPIGEAEFRGIYWRLLPLIRTEWVLLAEHQGEPAGLCLAVPDLLQIRRGVPLNTVIIKSITVKPRFSGLGLGGLLMAEVTRRACAQGMRRSIHALMHQQNPSMRISGRMMRPFRTYTLYARPL